MMKILLITGFAFLMLLSAQGQDTAQLNFLRNHRTRVSTTAVANSLFDSTFYNSSYFFFGENHGSAKPQEIDYTLFTHLHRKAGIKYYIAEVDFTKAWLLNQYLRSGNTKQLDKVFASWKRDTAQWANQEYYNKFVKLYAYQTTLPEKDQFSIIGIDVPQDLGLFKEHVAALTAKKKLGRFQHLIDTLQQLSADSSRKELIAFSKRLLPVLKTNASFFATTLGGSYTDFLHFVTSLTWLSAGNNRDKVMFLNFTNQLSARKLEKEKMYGFLGFYHCLQTGYNNSRPFAALLKDSIGQQRQITSLTMLAIDSETMLPYMGPIKQMMPKTVADKILQEHPLFPKSGKYLPYGLSNTSPMMAVQGMDLLQQLSEPESVYLFRLSGNGSPFAHTKQLSEISGFQTVSMTNKEDNTLNAFQYILLFRNSAAATPLD